MNPGPPCPTCFGPLTWYPQQQQWGCERCRVMLPTPMQARPAVLLPPTVMVRPGGGPMAKRTLWPWFVGGAVLVGGGIAAGLLLFRGGGSSSGAASLTGTTDRDALVRATFESLGKGSSIDDLVKRSGLSELRGVMRCSDPKQAEQTMTSAAAASRTAFEHALDITNGLRFEVTSIREDGAPVRTEKGESPEPGCTLEVPLVRHELAVAAKLLHRDGPEALDVTAKLGVVEADGHYYVVVPPTVPPCATAAARIALLGINQTHVRDAAIAAQAIVFERCQAEHWSDDVTKCATSAIGLDKAQACFAKLPDASQDKLRTALAGKLASGPPPLAKLVPDKASATSDTPADVTYGTPERAPVGDFWVWPRSDGWFLVSSPVFEAVFPRAPKFELKLSDDKTADGKPFDVYQITDDYGEGGNLIVSVLALGANTRDVGGPDPVKARLQKIGAVVESHFDDHGMPVAEYRIDEPATKTTLRVDVRKDFPRGIVVTSVSTVIHDATHAIFVDRFLAGVHVRGSWDQAADPKPFAAVNSKKIGKKYVVRDGEFSVELPEAPKIEKLAHKPGAPFETMTATIEHASTLVIFSVIEEQAFDALRRTPRQLEIQAKDDLEAMAKVLVGEHPKMERATATMGGLPAIQLRARGKKAVLTESWFAWDRFQHRMYVLTCTKVACAPIAKSLKLVPPQPTR